MATSKICLRLHSWNTSSKISSAFRACSSFTVAEFIIARASAIARNMACNRSASSALDAILLSWPNLLKLLRLDTYSIVEIIRKSTNNQHIKIEQLQTSTRNISGAGNISNFNNFLFTTKS
ncbi:hypothetical protein Droror1_Dr00011975 [Drosera rotundifolia]